MLSSSLDDGVEIGEGDDMCESVKSGNRHVGTFRKDRVASSLPQRLTHRTESMSEGGLARFKNDAQSGPALSAEEIQLRRQHVLEIWSAFKSSAAHRRAKLEDSRTLQHFIRDCDELETWISQKLAVATDQDSSNLQGKSSMYRSR